MKKIIATTADAAEFISHAIKRYEKLPNPYSISTKFELCEVQLSWNVDNRQMVFLYIFAPPYNLTDNRMYYEETRTKNGKLIRLRLLDDTSEKIYHAPNPKITIINIQ